MHVVSYGIIWIEWFLYKSFLKTSVLVESVRDIIISILNIKLSLKLGMTTEFA